MNITGYSERGALNALLFEISYSSRPTELLMRLLRRATFPLYGESLAEITDASALIEQSLSDFGDADAILLLKHHSNKSAVFVEAKVKPSQAPAWTIDTEFASFVAGIESKVSSSNLFTQLYHKVRFVNAANCGTLASGVPFPSCSTKAIRKIGSNPVVLRAVQKVTPYLQDVRYVAIVPDKAANVIRFVQETLKSFTPTAFDAWDVTRWGFISWSDVREYCAREGLERAADVLKFNDGQID